MVSLVRVAITGGKGATINNTKGVYLFVGGGVVIIVVAVVALYLLFSPSRTTPASPRPNYSQTAVAENEIRKQNAEATRTANSTPTPTIPPITPTPNAHPKMATARAKQGEQIRSVTTPSASNELTPAQEQAVKELLDILDDKPSSNRAVDGSHCLDSDGHHNGFERLVRSTLKHPSSMRTVSTIVMPDFGNGEHEIAMQFSAYMDEYGGEKNWIVYGVFDSRTCKSSITE